jgi:hypothetical protein
LLRNGTNPKFLYGSNGYGPVSAGIYPQHHHPRLLPHRSTPFLTRPVNHFIGFITRVDDFGRLITLFKVFVNLVGHFIELRARKSATFGCPGDSSMRDPAVVGAHEGR